MGKWKKEMTETLELPKDLVYGSVLVSVTGREEIFIENYRGILEYDSSHIRLQTKGCRLVINGSHLHIRYYTNDEMKITGFIEQIVYDP